MTEAYLMMALVAAFLQVIIGVVMLFGCDNY